MQAKSQQEHLRLIDLLKAQLRKSESEIATLHTQLHNKGGMGGSTVRNESGIKDTREKNFRYNRLEGNYSNLESAYNAQEKELERVKKEFYDAQDQIREDTTKILQLETQVRTAELAARTAQDLQSQLEESNRARRRLESNLRDLAASPFHQDAERVLEPRLLKVELLCVFECAQRFTLGG